MGPQESRTLPSVKLDDASFLRLYVAYTGSRRANIGYQKGFRRLNRKVARLEEELVAARRLIARYTERLTLVACAEATAIERMELGAAKVKPV